MSAASKYKQEYCEKLIEHMASGYSFESFTAVVGVHKDTLYEWVKAHQEFSEAKAIAFSKNLLFYEKLGVAGMRGQVDGFNVTAWIFNMKNRHKWRDRQPEEVDNTVINNNVSAKLSDEELEQEIQKEIQKEIEKRGMNQ